ncbi:unnamed protein product [Cuscuta campestris]|uniref:Beta-glucosidase n=1 Tax=Cuscuta campestris TaxID=132261 RepID=A0A484MIT4_9ASTE|nr:unnamed protein product [Cuscuta campestris]
MHGSSSSAAESLPPPSSNNNHVVAAAAADASPFAPIAIDAHHFPPHFIFGAASSAYQIEGAHNKSGKGPSILDTFFHDYPERTEDGSNGDLAVDFYHKYEEDIKRMSSELGINAFRFSIAWSRVIPSGRVSEGVNEEGISFYNKVINEVIRNGLEPFVTIFHYDVPQALEDKYGGFLSERIVSDYKDFAELCFQRFGDRVKHWITFNEPYQFSMGGWESGMSAPGRCSSWVNRACQAGDSSTEPYIIAHNLLLAHAHAVNLFKTKYQDLDSTPKGQIGITLDVTWSEPLSDGHEDIDAALTNLDFTYGWFMDPMTYGQYPKRMTALVGERLPKFTWDEIRMLKNAYDFVGINYYTSTYVSANFTPDPNPNHIKVSTDRRVTLTPYKNGIPIGEQATPTWLHVYPKGIFEILKYTKDTYRNPLIYITENGVGDPVDLSPQDAAKDTWRINYHMKHLFYVRQAICEENVNVKGYFAWSYIDNLEWQSGYAVRMGLYNVDRSTKELTRTPKWSVNWFHNFLNKTDSSASGSINPDACRRLIPIRLDETEQQLPCAIGAVANYPKVAHDEL